MLPLLSRSELPFVVFAIVFLIVYRILSESDTMSASKQSLRLVILSDTHRYFRHPVPDGDILVHCGDSEWRVDEANDWASKLPHANKIFVSGNMDRRFKGKTNEFRDIIYLQDSMVEVNGLKIYGSPWTPEFVGEFQLSNKKQAEDVWDGVPNDVDILITHGPPKGILDTTSRGLRVGDAVLLEKVREVKPRVHCFGHVHESYGTVMNDGPTLFCNAAVFNGHAPLVVDIPFDHTKPARLVA
ncbi:metallophosphoesterase [Gracilaria domingensis]|nr:metallophosphoesterase [Gracilaria domingensis]